MTSPFEPVGKATLYFQRHCDLLINFRNRDPDNPGVFIDYPAGTLAVLEIDTAPDSLPIDGVISGHNCLVRVPSENGDVLKRETWGFRLRYVDAGFPDGYFDKVVINGMCARDDGKPLS